LSLAIAGEANLSRGLIKQEEQEYQNEVFKQWWGTELARKFDDLPTEGKVPDFRIPYSGHIYPDRGGGTDARQGRGMSPLGKYDTAFNDRRGLAVAHERMDVTAHRDGRPSEPGLFGRRRERLEQLDRPIGLFERMRTRRGERWYGHCNGWTAAAIRHAEPQKSVVRNGVTFTPADIKCLLAELYMYSETEFLGGVDQVINPGTLHLTLTNWIGRGDHPVGMDTTAGKVVWNYPIYAYKATVKKHADRQVEVNLTATYAMNAGRETDKSPRLNKEMPFHYMLHLDKDGNVIGGYYLAGSNQIDMLWAPVKPTQGGEKGNENGNPHLSCDEILSIWRDSAPEELREKWLNIDPIQPKEESDDEDKDEKDKDDEKKPARVAKEE